MVYDSVKDIKDACNEMLRFAENWSDRVDVHYAAKTLSSSLNKLTSEYDKDDYDEKRIKSLKDDCEKEAVKMEYCLQRLNPVYKERYQSRMHVLSINEELKQAIQRQFKYNSRSELGNLLAAYSVMEDIVASVSHIKFELTSENMELLDIVKETIDAAMKSGSDQLDSKG